MPSGLKSPMMAKLVLDHGGRLWSHKARDPLGRNLRWWELQVRHARFQSLGDHCRGERTAPTSVCVDTDDAPSDLRVPACQLKRKRSSERVADQVGPLEINATAERR